MKEYHSKKCGFLREIDLFGKDIDIYYKGKSQRTSCLGRIFTILYIATYIAFFIYKIMRMMNKSDVTFYDTYVFNGEPPSFQLNHEKFYAGFAILDPLTLRPYIDPSIYEVQVIYYKGKKNATGWDWKYYELPLEICNISKFGSNYQDIFKDKSVNNFICLSNFEQILEGHLTYDVYSYYTVKFFPCFNSTKNKNKCKSPIEIYKKLSKFGVTFMMQDIDLTPYNYHKPIEYRAKELTASIGANLFQDIRAFLQVINIQTDEDILGFEALNSVRREKYIKYDEAQILSRLKVANNFPYSNESLIELTLALSEQELTQIRTYPKLIEVLGDVGGLMEVFFSLFKIIISFLTDVLYKKSLVNHLFSFDLDKNLILIKNRSFEFLQKKNSIKIYEPNVDNNNESKSFVNSDKSLTLKNIPNNRNKNNKLKTSIKKKKKIKLFKKYSYNHIFNNKNENAKENEKSIKIKEIDDSNRKMKLNIINDNDCNKFNMQTNFKSILKETENKNENIITKISLNYLATYICIHKRNHYLGNILFIEGMKLIVEKLDIQNLFKKVYKEEIINDKNPQLESIQMSQMCKGNLQNLYNKKVI